MQPSDGKSRIASTGPAVSDGNDSTGRAIAFENFSKVELLGKFLSSPCDSCDLWEIRLLIERLRFIPVLARIVKEVFLRPT
jgi:hypothetical protein